jgi:hypothetical protein
MPALLQTAGVIELASYGQEDSFAVVSCATGALPGPPRGNVWGNSFSVESTTQQNHSYSEIIRIPQPPRGAATSYQHPTAV